MARQLVLRIRRLDLLYFDEAFVSDMMLADAPSGVIVNALRWEILNDWVQYLNGDTSKDKTAEMSYRWGFVKRDTGFDSLKCLWGKHEHNYPMFAEAVWLSAAEGSGNGAEARGGSGRAAAGCRVTVPSTGPQECHHCHARGPWCVRLGVKSSRPPWRRSSRRLRRRS
ncbi:hypothetical protein OG298_40320 [Streptomyces sp. NBC_01005]|uniref:hypothetical protein n=1 Tax=unclassified Streptomyces TaxID=2593676 RepID=UPI0038646241|nr:hypothetical protein OG298_40320 [Streptomyces sp. NBC_01005]WTC99616.1 hypothetical protein OH736_40335 [Streptomyces sp. NBC_01650]